MSGSPSGSPRRPHHQQLYDQSRHRSPWRNDFRRRCLAEMRRRRADFLMRARQLDADGVETLTDGGDAAAGWDVRRELEQLLDAEGGAAAFEWVDGDDLLEIEAAMRRELAACGCACPACRVRPLQVVAAPGGDSRRRLLVCDCGLRVRLPAAAAGAGTGDASAEAATDVGVSLGELRESLLDCASAHASQCGEETALLVVEDGQGADSLIVACDHCQFCYALL